jgi:hypothetical protein
MSQQPDETIFAEQTLRHYRISGCRIHYTDTADTADQAYDSENQTKPQK